MPITNVISGITIAQARPAKIFPVQAARATAITGVKPPNSPLPRWYGTDRQVYRIRAGKNSTRKAAIGAYTIVTWKTRMKLSPIRTGTFGGDAFAAIPAKIG